MLRASVCEKQGYSCDMFGYHSDRRDADGRSALDVMKQEFPPVQPSYILRYWCLLHLGPSAPHMMW